MKKVLAGILGVAISAAVFCVIGYFLLKDYRIFEVTGNNMYPSFEENDRIIIDTSVSEYERYDIIVCENSFEEGGYYIERIFGLPGETVMIQEGVIYIDGEAVSDPYDYEADFYGYDAYEGVTLGAEEYFVLGDNRNNSADSRMGEFGAVALSDIYGKAVFRIWPFHSIGSLKLQ